MEQDLHEIARERANKYAPRPDKPPMFYGMIGAFTFAAGVTVFDIFLGLDLNKNDNYFPALITVVIGFLVPFLYLQHLERKYLKAFNKEFEELQRQQKAQNARED